MIKLGLIGRNISHSLSQRVYENILQKKICYDLLDFKSKNEIPSLTGLLAQYSGISVTTPYKTVFNEQIDKMSTQVETLGSCNCLYLKHGLVHAENTDVLALEILFLEFKEVNSVIILGDGVMSKMMAHVLQKKGLSAQIYSRKTHLDIHKLDLSDIGNNALVINACSRNFVFKGSLPTNCIFWDFNYNFEPHQKLWSHRDKVTYKDGQELLRLQAQISLKFWSLI